MNSEYFRQTQIALPAVELGMLNIMVLAFRSIEIALRNGNQEWLKRNNKSL